jgi:hypothetical protein
MEAFSAYPYFKSLELVSGSKLAVVDSNSYAPSSRRREDPVSKYISGLGRNKNKIMGPEGARNQE